MQILDLKPEPYALRLTLLFYLLLVRLCSDDLNLTQKLQEGLREIENAVSNTVARVFEPFLIECMREQAITMLAETLEALLTKGEGTNLEICGPEDLLQLLREKLVIQGIKAALTPANTPDLRVKVGQTVIETQLAAWISKFEEVVNE